MVAVLGYSKEQIAEAVKAMYTEVATAPDSPFHFPVGAEAARLAGYDEALLGGLPVSALNSFAGVGCPFRAGVIEEGDVVLDIGSGAGVDAFIASRLVGPKGEVLALDMTPAMREKLRALARAEGATNIEVLDGNAEAIPLPDASVDVVTSNGVLNLVPDKRRAMAEIFRVLKPEGRVQIADIVIRRPVTPDCLDDPKLWAECVVGATVDEDYLDMFRDAGFEDVAVIEEADYFRHSPSAETREIASAFGAYSVVLSMRRGEPVPTVVHWTGRLNPRRLARQVGRRGLWGTVALAMALLACYGTLAGVGALSALGLGVAINESVWASVILAATALAWAAVLAGIRKHRQLPPAVLATLGAAVIAYTMLVSYDRLVELAGFALLAGGVLWDVRARNRWPAVRPRHKPA